jgi:hypothetical protein
MARIFDSLAKPFNALAVEGAPSWVMLALAIVMFGGWTATYIAIIRKGRKDKAYGVPFLNTCLNSSWEMIFAFNWMGGLPEFIFPLQLGHIFWLGMDSINVYQTLRYGPGIQKSSWASKNFRLLFLATFVGSFTLVYTYHQYANDVFGVASSWIINVLMSWLFIRMFLERRDQIMADGTIRGMSIPAAWFKFIGNAAGAVFCFYWWPGQFHDRVLTHNGFTIPEPTSWTFLYVVYITNLMLDAGLIYLLRKREKEVKASGVVVASREEKFATV